MAAVPVIYSSLQDGSYPQLLHLASLSGILKCKVLSFVNQTQIGNSHFLIHDVHMILPFAKIFISPNSVKGWNL